MTLQVEVKVEVGCTDGRDPSEADETYGGRLGPIIKKDAETNATLEACPVSTTPLKYLLQPTLEGGFVLVITVEVNRERTNATGVALWRIMEAAKATLDAAIAKEYQEAGSHLLETLVDLCRPRPAAPASGSQPLHWVDNEPEGRSRG